MPTWPSSLRLTRDVVVGVCMVALVWPATSFAAGGMPWPAPDDPPSEFTATVTEAPKPKPVTSAPRVAPKRDAESAQAVPTPDAPMVAASSAVVATTKQPAPSTTPSPTPDVSRSVSLSPAAPSSRHRPVVAAMTPPTRTVRPAPRTAKPASVKRASKVAAKHAPAPRPPASKPRDAVRLGLPVGVLSLRPPDDGLSGALLVMAAILLAAAACGSTVLGVAARSATRQA